MRQGARATERRISILVFKMDGERSKNKRLGKKNEEVQDQGKLVRLG